MPPLNQLRVAQKSGKLVAILWHRGEADARRSISTPNGTNVNFRQLPRSASDVRHILKISQHKQFAVTGRSVFERALEALPDGVLLTDVHRRVVYANRAFAEQWSIPPHLVESGDDMALLSFVSDQLVDPAGFRQEVERLTPSDESTEDEIRFKDGRIFSRRSVPCVERGSIEARIWIFTDVTEARNSLLDVLTGLPNRRAYSRSFPLRISMPDDGLFQSVAIMDVDNFKAYNDWYGHAAGDAVLRGIGSIIRSHFQEADDLMFRIGGEEFLIASKNRSLIDAFSLFDSVRGRVEAERTAHAGNLALQRRHGVDGAGLLSRAEGASDGVRAGRCRPLSSQDKWSQCHGSHHVLKLLR